MPPGTLPDCRASCTFWFIGVKGDIRRKHFVRTAGVLYSFSRLEKHQRIASTSAVARVPQKDSLDWLLPIWCLRLIMDGASDLTHYMDKGLLIQHIQEAIHKQKHPVRPPF